MSLPPSNFGTQIVVGTVHWGLVSRWPVVSNKSPNKPRGHSRSDDLCSAQYCSIGPTTGYICTRQKRAPMGYGGARFFSYLVAKRTITNHHIFPYYVSNRSLRTASPPAISPATQATTHGQECPRLSIILQEVKSAYNICK